MLENMIAICVDRKVTGGGLTFGKKYDVIKRALILAVGESFS